MGYIEDIQKINSLAKDLLNHGMAKSLDEAVVQAKKMLKNDVDLAKIPNPGSDYKKVEDEEDDVRVEEINSKSMEALEEKESEQEKISWQEAMKMNNEYIVGQLKKYESALQMFNDEISALKRQMTDLKEGQKIMNMVREQPQQQQQNLQPEPNQQSQEPQKTHPKTGSSDPGEFAVEKIFYFGKK